MDASSQSWQRVVGVDVGGTKIAAAAVDPQNGLVTDRQVVPTQPKRGAAAILDDVATLVAGIMAVSLVESQPISGIGVGVPELVDADGRIQGSYLCDWSQAPIERRLGAFAPVVVESDVRAAAQAEAMFGAGRRFPTFVYVSVGTGISSTFVQERMPLTGARGGALVLSSAPIAVPCRICDGWNEFVLEDYASGPALVQRFAARRGVRLAGAEDVLAAAAGGDVVAAEIVESAATALGSAIAWLVNVLDPHGIVIGGGLGLAPGLFQDRLRSSVRERVWNPEARGLPIVPAALGADAGLVGAALSAHNRVEPGGRSLGSRIAVLNGERREAASSPSQP